jgi:hypothetical protein
MKRRCRTSYGSSRVRVDHEEALPGSVERDRVGGLAPDSRHGQELRAQPCRVIRFHRLHPPAVLPAEEVEERAQPPRLDVEATGRADERRDLGGGQITQGLVGEKVTRAEHVERLLDVRPGRVLHQDGPDADLERGLGRPPSGLPAPRHQLPVDLVEIDRTPPRTAHATIVDRWHRSAQTVDTAEGTADNALNPGRVWISRHNPRC